MKSSVAILLIPSFRHALSQEIACLSEDQCRWRALDLGLQLGGAGFDFAAAGGDGYLDGCHFYVDGAFGGRAYFGTGGTKADMSAATADGACQRRLWCVDGGEDYFSFDVVGDCFSSYPNHWIDDCSGLKICDDAGVLVLGDVGNPLVGESVSRGYTLPDGSQSDSLTATAASAVALSAASATTPTASSISRLLEENACSQDSDCGTGGQCGRKEALESAGKVCCESGRVYQGFSMSYVCDQRATGAACKGENSICASGICGMGDLCLADKVSNSSPCRNDEQCASGECGREEALKGAGKVCCGSGKVYQGYSMSYVCNERPVGAACDGEDSICASGVCGMDKLCLADKISNLNPCRNDEQCASGECGREEALKSAGKVCCESGKVYQGFSMSYVCNERPVGAACDEENSICASGVCGMDDLCLAEKISTTSPCKNDEHCASGKCGREEALQSAGKVCCESGKVWGGFSVNHVCTERPTGATCNGENSICASGVCGVDDLCLAAKIQDENTPCTNDDQCLSGKCARSAVLGSAEYLCCTSGDAKYINYKIQHVCTERVDGVACGTENSICASGVCGMDSLCQAEKIENESNCRNDDQCQSGQCSRSEALKSADYVCCTSGDSERINYDIKNVCTEREVGVACGGKNSVCASGVCGIDNVCLAEKIEDEQNCTNNEQCSSGKCARSGALKSADYVCCTSGDSEHINYDIKNVCTERAVGVACGGKNSVCASGVCGIDNACLAEKIEDEQSCTNNEQCSSGECARSEALESAGYVCCASGDSEYINYDIRNVCTERAAGVACEVENSVCSSGVCGMDNICLREKLKNESTCRNSDQCQSGECARSEALESAGYVCCTSGDSEYINYDIKNVCTERAAGAACGGDDSVCFSGSCGADILCTKQLDSNPCNGTNDDCVNNSCGRVEALQSAEFICCPSGETVDGGSDSLTVCANIGNEGDACFDDSICQSNVCILGLCKNGKQEQEGESCEADDHCASGTCINIDADGLGSCAPFSSLDARNAYFNDVAKCSLDTIDSSNSNNDDRVVTLQVYGDSSESAWTGTLVNMATTPKRDQTATANNVFGQKLLSGIAGCWGGSSVVAQRQGEDVCFAYQKEDDDGDGNIVASCLQKCIKIGSSGTFETYDKSDTDVIGGFFGTPVQIFYFGETQKCRIIVEYGSNQLAPTLTAGTQGGTAPSETSPSSMDGETTWTKQNDDTPQDISDMLIDAKADDTENCAIMTSFVALPFLPLLVLALYCCLV